MKGWARAWWLAPLVGVAWAAVAWLAWGAVHPLPLDHDEAAYLLQSQVFAMGRWAMPAPPVPEFFTQAHVLVTPVLASKYPPGHSLVLALGALLGAPALMIFVLNAVRIGLGFALARRLAGAPVALLASALLYLGAGQSRFSSSYYSQLTSSACLAAAWWCLWRWHDGAGRRWLVGVAAAIGWCAITRPWTAVACVAPIAYVVLRDVVRRRQWRDLALAVAVGTAVVGVLPLWARGTTGDWRRLPLVEYARDYMPFDYPHFGVEPAQPRRDVPPDLASINASLRLAERDHVVANMPRDAVARLRNLAADTRIPPAVLALLVALGLLALPRAGWVAATTVATQFLAYLAHPTWPQWTVYWFEIVPVVVFLAALGVVATLQRLARGRPAWQARISAVTLVLAGACALLMLPAARAVHAGLAVANAPRAHFEAELAALPAPAVVFVRYGPGHSPHRSLIVNRPDWPTAPVWVAYDRGADDARLLARAGGRRAFLYDENDDSFQPIAR